MKAYVVTPPKTQQGMYELLQWLKGKKRGGDIVHEGLVTGLHDEEVEELRDAGNEVVDLETLRGAEEVTEVKHKHRRVICCCAGCGETMYVGDDTVQHPVADVEGDLDFIELAHRKCEPEWAKYDDWSGEGMPS